MRRKSCRQCPRPHQLMSQWHRLLLHHSLHLQSLHLDHQAQSQQPALPTASPPQLHGPGPHQHWIVLHLLLRALQIAGHLQLLQLAGSQQEPP